MVLVMNRYPFWFFTSLVLAVLAHIYYVLFIPSGSFNAAIDQALGDQPVNSFVVLTPEAQMKLMPFTSASHLVGICKFDTSDDKIRVTAKMPEGLWNFAVYSLRGKQVYAINDKQADTNGFTVELARSEGMLGQVLGLGEDAVDVSTDDLGWRIAMPTAQGLAVLWFAVPDPLLREAAIAEMKNSRCGKNNS
jgi:uncharacterized membrane protein